MLANGGSAAVCSFHTRGQLEEKSAALRAKRCRRLAELAHPKLVRASL
jgi:hypothetical protein